MPGFAATYLIDGKAPPTGALFRNPALAGTLARLGRDGLDDFYRGALARDIAAGLAKAGSPVSADDLVRYRPLTVRPLELTLAQGTAYNLPPRPRGWRR